LLIGLGPPLVLVTEMIGELLMEPVKGRGRIAKAAVLLLIGVVTIAVATWVNTSQAFGLWWRTNFGGG
jgi:hypothetical protein